MKSLIMLSKKWTSLTLISIFVFTSCQKEKALPDVTTETPAKTIAASAKKTDKESSNVATDWYRLQFRILLERNSAFNGIYFSYIGIGLYEAVRPGIKGAVSFSGKLNSMPAMPQPENNMGYSWPLSANAALAAMVRSFFSGLRQLTKPASIHLKRLITKNCNRPRTLKCLPVHRLMAAALQKLCTIGF